MNKDIVLGDNTIPVRATPLTLLFYKQEFKRDLLGDLMTMQALEKDISKLDSITLLQFLWAMAKTENLSENMGKSFPSFNTWVSKLERIDFSGDGIKELVGLITDAYFRGTQGK